MSEVVLSSVELKLNASGELCVDISTVNPEQLKRALDDWSPDYQNTESIVSTVRESNRLVRLLARQLELYLNAL